MSVLDELLLCARVFARHWRDQRGVNAVVLDGLATAIEAFDKSGSVELICPACGADYAEAEKKNALFQTPQFRELVADISRRRMCTIAEAEQLAREGVVVLPPGAGKTELLSCCVKGDHSFSWRQGIEPCRYCGKPVKP